MHAEVDDDKAEEAQELVDEIHELIVDRDINVVMTALAAIVANGVCITAYTKGKLEEQVEIQLTLMVRHIREWVKCFLDEKRRQDGIQ